MKFLWRQYCIVHVKFLFVKGLNMTILTLTKPCVGVIHENTLSFHRDQNQ